MGHYRSEMVDLDAEERREKALLREFAQKHEKALRAITQVFGDAADDIVEYMLEVHKKDARYNRYVLPSQTDRALGYIDEPAKKNDRG